MLVVDGSSSVRCALVGGNLGMLAEKNGCAGILVYGTVRDTRELDACEVGIRALAVHYTAQPKIGASANGTLPSRSLVSRSGGRDLRGGGWRPHLYHEANLSERDHYAERLCLRNTA
ncbi:demethylmenaquinone methyltransferase [Mycetohabitans endofungorum]|uniref:Putative 4-hydroxy-4-methyl-2-oxoglutarate aldolase n=1 Tax=Mycetohabitans endofungorum TaxID=417203 RepID=A0A2P5K874_9BURK|nr:demethylmenaquinone methyltransferase [Mycetohabitans endofungorum]